MPRRTCDDAQPSGVGRNAIWSVLIIAAVSACDQYDRPQRPLPDGFEVSMLDGRRLVAADFKGKPWVVNLWVPGCAPCLEEFSALEKIRPSAESQGIGFLALSLEPDVELVRAGVSRAGIAMPVGIALGETLAPLAVNQVPSTVFLAADGTIAMSVSGKRSEAFFARRIRQLLESVASKRD